MPSKRKRGTSSSESRSEDAERSPTPTPSGSAVKKRKKELQYDPMGEPSNSGLDPSQSLMSTQGAEDVDVADIIQELFETIRNYKSEEGKLLCESFIRVPKRRTNPDYYEVVTQPIDMLRIQQKMKTDEYEEIEQLTADVELIVNNARAYYKKGSQEYIDATDLLDLYYEIRDELLVETFGDTKEIIEDDDDEGEVDDVPLEDIQSKIGSIIQQEEAALQGTLDTSGGDDKAFDPEDFEQLFATIVNSQDGERGISEPFHLLPYKTLYPNYYEIIKEPIDLKMIARKIQDNAYRTLDDMDKDLNLMVFNAKTYNEPKSLIFKDACTIKKIFDVKKREIEHRKINAKSSERLRTRGGNTGQKLTAQFAALEYPEPIDPTDIMEYEEDSGAETVMSEEESPMWNLFNVVKNYTMPDGSKITDPYMKLPSRRYYPDYYEEIKKPLSLINVQKKLKSGAYSCLDELATDLNLVFDNAKQYNADESVIYKERMEVCKKLSIFSPKLRKVEEKRSYSRKNSCLLQKVVLEKKKELEKFGFKEMSIPELGIHFEFPMLEKEDAKKMTKDAFDEDHASKNRNRKPPVTPVDTKKGIVPRKINPDELLRKRLWTLYKTVFEYADGSGRLLRQIFMFLPAKRDYPDYYKVITDPIDMSIIETKIKSDKYPSEYNLMSDFDLMFKNARHYNEEGSQVYSDAITLEKALKAKWRVINQSAGVPRPMKTKTRKNPATSLPSRLQDLYETIRDYQDMRGRSLSSPFMKVPMKSDYPDYYEVIKRPIDMSQIQQKMLLKKYESLEDMVADYVQMFDNACKYNEPDSLIYKDALTLQRVCLEKKVELCDDWTNEVPDVRAVMQEMMTNLFISTYNHQDEEGRCYSDSFSELPERDPEADPNSEKPLSFDMIKRNVDRGRYRRLDRFQEDMFRVFERARRLSRTDSQLYEDAIEMQLYFMKTRDELCKNGETLLTPALSFTERHLIAVVEAEKSVKLMHEQREDDEKKKSGDQDEGPQHESTSGIGSENSLHYKDQIYNVGDFVYVEPRTKSGRVRARKSRYSREPDSEPHIMCIEKIFTDTAGQQQVYGNWFYRPNETFHLATRKFLQKEVFKSDYYTSMTPSQILTKCFVMNVRDYFKLRPEGIADSDVYVCEFRYTARTKTFKKIKIWSVPSNEEIQLVPREVPLTPVRIASMFADKLKEDYDDGDTSILETLRNDVILEGQATDEGHIFFEQLRTITGSYKMGDCVYVKSDQLKPMIYRIDKIWMDMNHQRYFYGPLFIHPSDIEHAPTRLFYKNEMFLCGVEEARTMDSIIGKCCVLHIKEYCSSRPTEISERDMYLCESKYHENEKTIRKLPKGLKKHVLSPRVTDDEILFFKKSIIPSKADSSSTNRVAHTHQEPSPFLAKAAEDASYDGDESRDAFSDAIPEVVNTRMEDFSTPVHHPVEVKTPKSSAKAGDHEESGKKKAGDHDGETSKKKVKSGNVKRTQISGYIVFSGEYRKLTQQEHPDCTFGEISRIVGAKVRVKRFPSGYLLFSAHIRKKISEEKKGEYTFGEISRLVGIQWRNLEKEEKEKYEEKAKRIAEEQQAKQEAAEKAFNETLNKTQQTADAQAQTTGPSNRPATPANQGYHPQGYYPGPHPLGYSPGMGQPGAQYGPGHTLGGHNGPPYPGVPNGMGGPFMSPGGQRGGPANLPNGHTPQGQRQAFMPQYQSPAGGGGMRQGAPPYPGQQQMAPPPPPPRPPSPMFVTVPQRTQRLLHSEAYLKYIEGLNADSRTISDWDKTLSATPENTSTPDESRLPTHWLAQGAGYHGSVTDALWALRDLMLKDALHIQRTLPFEALYLSVCGGSMVVWNWRDTDRPITSLYSSPAMRFNRCMHKERWNGTVVSLRHAPYYPVLET